MIVVADPAGGYGVSLSLVATLVPLHPLAARIRERVRRAGATGPIDVTFVDVEAS